MKRLGAKAAGNGGSSGNGRTSGSGAKAGARSSGGGGGSEFYGGSDVIDLDGSNFESEVLDSEDVWMVRHGRCFLQLKCTVTSAIAFLTPHCPRNFL